MIDALRVHRGLVGGELAVVDELLRPGCGRR